MNLSQYCRVSHRFTESKDWLFFSSSWGFFFIRGCVVFFEYIPTRCDPGWSSGIGSCPATYTILVLKRRTWLASLKDEAVSEVSYILVFCTTFFDNFILILSRMKIGFSVLFWHHHMLRTDDVIFLTARFISLIDYYLGNLGFCAFLVSTFVVFDWVTVS